MGLAFVGLILVGILAIYFLGIQRVRHARRLEEAAEGFDDNEEGRLIKWAGDVVGTYADLLEGNKADLLLPESALPASRDDIKRALLITACTQLRKGIITDADLDVYRTGYMLLMNFVPDDAARRARERTAAVKAWRESPTRSNLDLQTALKTFANNPDAVTGEGSTSQGIELVAEFEARMAKLRSGAYPLGAA